MYFKRKAYKELLDWKEKYADRYAVLLEGARRVGKSTISEQFAINEYKSYILIDFSNVSSEIIECFDDINNLDMFFLRLQAITGIDLYPHESVIIFDEVQLFPKARQAIKHLVKDGRYHYIETGSLISIKKNVKDILIPSEEMKIQVYPMDYEEFCNATGKNYSMLKNLFEMNKAVGQQVNRKLMRDIRIYMAVGGMPQAVEAYTNGANFSMIDQVKRQIINLYEEDFKKIDSSGRLSSMYHSIPAQLSKDTKRYRISTALGKRKSSKDDNLLYDLIDSKTVLPCYNSTDPRVSISLTKDLDSYKLYIADTGLFITLMFIDRPVTENEIYAKLLSDKLPANLGYLYENLVAQILTASGRELYYHTWEKDGSTHYYEIDFLISQGSKVSAIEVKSSGTGKHESMSEFRKRYSKNIKECFIVSQKDVDKKDDFKYIPVYMTTFLTR
ncbi:ATP-binding protein [Clostridium sp. HCP1S3_B4]|uniref:ATP-binding protein n=1 Tax=unclassified Clostridium TaxID=2614128 RepID=UPI00168ED647|nr:AAA family ATPase [Clostridiales bacterium]NLK23894.1 ATP-binding protein [Clostridiales bacterium]